MYNTANNSPLKYLRKRTNKTLWICKMIMKDIKIPKVQSKSQTLRHCLVQRKKIRKVKVFSYLVIYIYHWAINFLSSSHTFSWLTNFIIHHYLYLPSSPFHFLFLHFPFSTPNKLQTIAFSITTCILNNCIIYN